MASVFLAEDGLLYGDAPVDAQVWVQDGDAAIGLGSIVVVAFVLKDSSVAKHCKSMGESVRDEELPMIFSGKLHSHVLSISRASFADVNHYIKHCAFDTAHQLGLSVRGALEMQPAHHASGAGALVVLHKIYASDLVTEIPMVIALKEIASRVVEDLWLDDEHSWDIGGNYIHRDKQ